MREANWVKAGGRNARVAEAGPRGTKKVAGQIHPPIREPLGGGGNDDRRLARRKPTARRPTQRVSPRGLPSVQVLRIVNQEGLLHARGRASAKIRARTFENSRSRCASAECNDNVRRYLRSWWPYLCSPRHGPRGTEMTVAASGRERGLRVLLAASKFWLTEDLARTTNARLRLAASPPATSGFREIDLSPRRMCAPKYNFLA